MIQQGKKLRKLVKKPPLMSGSLIFWLACLLGFGLLGAGCGSLPKESAEAQSQRQGTPGQMGGATPVDVAIARQELLQQQTPYRGDTRPFRTVSLRSQVEGRLLGLNVDVGDAISQGQIVGQVDDTLLRTELNQAEAELAALQSEVARANTQVRNAQVQQEQARLEVVQANADAQRQEQLLKEGAIAQQAAERAKTAAQTAQQALRAAQEQIQTEQEAVAAAKGRLTAQQALVAQAKERRSYSRLTSPIAGVVLEKVTEPGNLLQPGNEVIKIGDFSRVKVEVQVSDRELANIQVGQSAQVTLDAFPGQTYTGKVTRISPAAGTAYLVPVEIEISNKERRIGSGLYATVNFASQAEEQVVVPLSAVQGNNQQRNNNSTAARPVTNAQSQAENNQGRVFIISQSDGQAKVTARTVTLGQKADGKVQILSGLQPGERYVMRSGRPLKEGDTVRLSILSEKLDSDQVEGGGRRAEGRR